MIFLGFGLALTGSVPSLADGLHRSHRKLGFAVVSFAEDVRWDHLPARIIAM